MMTKWNYVLKLWFFFFLHILSIEIYNQIEFISKSKIFVCIFLVAEKHFLVETEGGDDGNNSTEYVEETSPEPRESNGGGDYSMYGSCLDQAKAMRRQGTKSQYSIIA